MPRRKATDAEYEQRVTAVYGLILNGASRPDILAYAAKETDKKQAWSVDDRQVDNYIRDARKLLKAHARVDRDYQLGQARERLNLLFARAMSIMDYKTALAVQKEINALEGLHAEPAAQTLRLIGLDTMQLGQLVEALESANIKPSDAFAAMMQRLAQGKPK